MKQGARRLAVWKTKNNHALCCAEKLVQVGSANMTENKGLLGEKVVNGNLGIGSQFVCENHIIIIAFPNGRSIDNEEKTSETMSIPLSST